MLETTTGIILRSRKSGESDRILVLLSVSDEVLQLKYHGIQASQRRSQLSVQPGNSVEVVFYRKSSQSDLYSIKELTLQKQLNVQGRYNDLQRLAAVLALVAIVVFAVMGRMRLSRTNPASTPIALIHSANAMGHSFCGTDTMHGWKATTFLAMQRRTPAAFVSLTVIM